MSLFNLFLCVLVESLVILLVAIYGVLGWRKLRKVSSPVKGKMLRPPGWSCGEEREKHAETCVLSALGAVYGSVALVLIIAGRGHQMQVSEKAVVQCLVGAGLLTGAVAAWATVPMRRSGDYGLGMRGEQLVGEQLQELVRVGCYVFHDFHPEKSWNIDHIVVAPESVLVIETKTRRRRGNESNAHEVIFDGKALHFPRFVDTHGLQQAERNAEWLGRYLNSALQERVKVEPVLALPGWMVRRKGRGSVYVVNPKEVRALVRARGSASATPAQLKRMRQIAFILEQKCRDVEF